MKKVCDEGSEAGELRKDREERRDKKRKLCAEGILLYYYCMKTYLEPNETIAFLVEWGGFVVFLALVLAPFLIIRYRWFRPTRIWHIVGAYAASFGVLIPLILIINKIDRLIYYNFINTHWIQEPLGNILFRGNILLLIWPLLIFYSTKLLFGNLTKKRFFIALTIAILFLALLLYIMMYIIAAGLGQIGQEHF